MSKGGALWLTLLGSPARARVVPPVAMALVPHIQGLVVRGLFLEHCFVTNAAPFMFPEVILVPFEPQKRDLQLWNWPRASTRQGGCLFNELPFWNVFAKVWWIWDLVLSPVRRHSGFWRSYWYHSNRKKEIYKFGMVSGRQISKEVNFWMVFVHCFWLFIDSFIRSFCWTLF